MKPALAGELAVHSSDPAGQVPCSNLSVQLLHVSNCMGSSAHTNGYHRTFNSIKLSMEALAI